VPYPRRLEHLLAGLLEKDRNRRPNSYDQVIRALALSHAQIVFGWDRTSRRIRQSELASKIRLGEARLEPESRKIASGPKT
jgi:hypothetical protein